MLKPKQKKPKDTAKTAFQKRIYEAEGWTLSFDQDGIATLSGKGDVKIITDGKVFARTPFGEDGTLSSPNIIRPNDLRPSVHIGQLVEGKGIYHGLVTLPPRYKVTLPPMHLWVAPNDVSHVSTICKKDQSLTLREANSVLDSLGDKRSNPWGRPGQCMVINSPDFASYEQNLYIYLDDIACQKSESGWFIPTKEIMDGRRTGERAVCVENNLEAHLMSIPYGSEYPNVEKWLMEKSHGSCTPSADGSQTAFAMKLGARSREKTTYTEKQRVLFRPVALDMNF